MGVRDPVVSLVPRSTTGYRLSSLRDWGKLSIQGLAFIEDWRSSRIGVHRGFAFIGDGVHRGLVSIHRGKLGHGRDFFEGCKPPEKWPE